MHHEFSEFIEILHFINAEDLAKNLLEIRENEKIRAAVLFFDLEKIENIKFTNELNEIIKNFPVPVISAITGNLPENAFLLLENSHLCIAEKSKNAIEA